MLRIRETGLHEPHSLAARGSFSNFTNRNRKSSRGKRDTAVPPEGSVMPHVGSLPYLTRRGPPDRITSGMAGSKGAHNPLEYKNSGEGNPPEQTAAEEPCGLPSTPGVYMTL